MGRAIHVYAQPNKKLRRQGIKEQKQRKKRLKAASEEYNRDILDDQSEINNNYIADYGDTPFFDDADYEEEKVKHEKIDYKLESGPVIKEYDIDNELLVDYNSAITSIESKLPSLVFKMDGKTSKPTAEDMIYRILPKVASGDINIVGYLSVSKRFKATNSNIKNATGVVLGDYPVMYKKGINKQRIGYLRLDDRGYRNKDVFNNSDYLTNYIEVVMTRGYKKIIMWLILILMGLLLLSRLPDDIQFNFKDFSIYNVVEEVKYNIDDVEIEHAAECRITEEDEIKLNLSIKGPERFSYKFKIVTVGTEKVLYESVELPTVGTIETIKLDQIPEESCGCELICEVYGAAKLGEVKSSFNINIE